ncbi:MAG: GTPase, partial [Planctomycetota bacterium]
RFSPVSGSGDRVTGGSGSLTADHSHVQPRIDVGDVRRPCRLEGVLSVTLASPPREAALPAALQVWPGRRSFTREPAAELHTLGSPPLLAAILNQLVNNGARLAEPGEFTLRAFLSGRIDLTQAEAVLGVVDATTDDDLAASLEQLAGGLCDPLDRLRNQVLNLLAELEAGLDFADEDLELISHDQLQSGVTDAQAIVASVLERLRSRQSDGAAPSVVLFGTSNIGKSTLFNHLAHAFGVEGAETADPALTSSQPGTTRDYVTARLRFGRLICVLFDTAGQLNRFPTEVDQFAHSQVDHVKRRADVLLHCVDANSAAAEEFDSVVPVDRRVIVVLTRSDLSDDVKALVERRASQGRWGARVHACSCV